MTMNWMSLTIWTVEDYCRPIFVAIATVFIFLVWTDKTQVRRLVKKTPKRLSQTTIMM